MFNPSCIILRVYVYKVFISKINFKRYYHNAYFKLNQQYVIRINDYSPLSRARMSLWFSFFYYDYNYLYSLKTICSFFHSCIYNCYKNRLNKYAIDKIGFELTLQTNQAYSYVWTITEYVNGTTISDADMFDDNSGNVLSYRPFSRNTFIIGVFDWPISFEQYFSLSLWTKIRYLIAQRRTG